MYFHENAKTVGVKIIECIPLNNYPLTNNLGKIIHPLRASIFLIGKINITLVLILREMIKFKHENA